MTTFLLTVSLLTLSVIAARILSRSSSGYDDRFLDLANSIPSTMWEEKDRRVLWSNNAFKELDHLSGAEPLTINSFKLSGDLVLDGAPVRAELQVEDSQASIPFNISMHQLQQHKYYFAQSATDAAKAEDERRRFVQNLSQTFAHLPVGVAVFDRDRDLSLFNPALANLLDLSPVWLAARPSLRAFLDQLRENGALPEPKNFKSWREQIVSLEDNASSGVYFEDWNLPDGSVYRVTGKPQPKGAVALFIEDISAPVGVEREYRSEIKRLYNGFDALNLGLAIFNPSGDLSFANNHFDELWGLDVSESILVPNIVTLTKALQEKCKPTPIWGDLRDFVSSVEERVDWSTDIELLDGQMISARFVPLSDGQTFCEFALINPILQLANPSTKAKIKQRS